MPFIDEQSWTFKASLPSILIDYLLVFTEQGNLEYRDDEILLWLYCPYKFLTMDTEVEKFLKPYKADKERILCIPIDALKEPKN